MLNQLVEETDSYLVIEGEAVSNTAAKKPARGASKAAGGTAATVAETDAAVGRVAGSRAAAEQQQSSGETGGIGVQSRESEIAMRGERGKFLPGHPATPGGGRKPIDRTPDIRAAIWKRYTLEEIFGRLDTAYRIAVEMKSSRGIVAAVTPIMEYGLGKPIQQVVHEAGRTELLEQLFEAKDTPLLPATGALLLPVTGDEA